MITIVVHEEVYDQLVNRIEKRRNAQYVQDDDFNACSIVINLGMTEFHVNYADYIDGAPNDPTNYRIHIQPSLDVQALTPYDCVEYLRKCYQVLCDDLEIEEKESPRERRIQELQNRIECLENTLKYPIEERFKALSEKVYALESLLYARPYRNGPY